MPIPDADAVPMTGEQRAKKLYRLAEAWVAAACAENTMIVLNMNCPTQTDAHTAAEAVFGAAITAALAGREREVERLRADSARERQRADEIALGLQRQLSDNRALNTKLSTRYAEGLEAAAKVADKKADELLALRDTLKPRHPLSTTYERAAREVRNVARDQRALATPHGQVTK